MNTRKWLVDYDSTIADLQGSMLRILNDRFGTQYTHETFSSWNTEDHIPQEHCEYMWGSNGFFNMDVQRAAEPVEGAVEGVLNLYNSGEQLMIVSDRKPVLYEVTRNWLDEQGLGFIRLLFTQSEYNTQTTGTKVGMSKREAAAKFGLTYIIEDAPHHAEAFGMSDTTERVFLLNKPWNQGVEGPKITRVSGWTELTEIVNETLYAETYEWGIV